MSFQYDLRIAGVRLRILAPQAITFPRNFLPFLDDDRKEPDIRIRLFFGTEDLTPYAGNRIIPITRRTVGGNIVRIEPAGEEKTYLLGIPLDMADSVCESGNWLLYMSLERMLQPFHRVILHASAVIHDGKAYVFTAPSGTGKSTQADIWSREFGAEIINGDKVILSVENGVVTAYGGPAAGSSNIYKNICAPVAAILILKQGTENVIVDSNNRSGYLALYSGLVKSSFDQEFNLSLLPCIEEILIRVPVLTLSCLPDRSAAQCVMDYLDQVGGGL